MTMITVSNTYNIDWRLKFAPNYAITNDGIVINVQRNKVLKRTVVGYSIGYYIESKFYTLKYLRTQLVKQQKIKIPF